MIHGYNELNNSIINILEKISSVVHSSKEQEKGIGYINNSIQDIDKAIRNNTQLTEEINKIAIESNNISQQLVEMNDKVEFIGKSDILIRGDKSKDLYKGIERRENKLYKAL